MKNGWKVIAIVFIITTIIGFSIVGWFMYEGNRVINQENECSYNVCADYDAFYYDVWEDVCYCYLDNEIVYQEYIG